MKIITISLAAILLTATLVLSGCGGDAAGNSQAPRSFMGDMSAQQSAPEISVKAQQAVRGSVATFILASTTLEAKRTVDVYSKGTGLVEEMKFEEGDRVGKDQLLVKLDEREVLNDYNQAKLAVEQAEIALQQARVRKEQAASDYERNEQLLRENLVSQQEYDRTKLDDRYAQLTLDDSEYALTVSRERFEAAKIQLENTEIRAPITGIVSARMVELGQMVRANDQVCTLTDMEHLLARVHIPETDIQRISTGQSARIEAESLTGREFRGTVTLISPVIDSETGTGKVTIEVTDRSGNLKPGMFVNAYLTTSVHDNVIKILRKAVWHEKEEDWVFIVKEDNTVEKRRIETGYTEEDWVEIKNGVNEKELVVTVGQDSLDEGFPIKIAEYEGPPPANGSLQAETPPPPQPSGPQRGGRGDMRAQMQALMENPEARKAMMEAREKNPEVFQDPEKRRAFFQELQEKYGKK
ncbi:MAG: efflux RND transporter periplasmic adaptor subunit [Acidobacteria bacterium]|nr:efflux RND transporter periplasmic adaptor subunit [Acidobacteriota bacterium]